jgi:hypothetical protein
MAEVNPAQLIIPPPQTTEKSLPDFHIYTFENFIIIWLDAHINPRYENHALVLAQLQHFVHFILPITDSDRCLDFISDISHEKIFLIVSGSLGEKLVPLIHNLNQIDSIYVYCESKSKHEKWALKEKKVKGVFTKPQPIYDALRRDIRQSEDDLNSFSIFSSTESNQIFIYTQLLKQILIEMDYQPDTKLDFASSCYSMYQNNSYQLQIIQEFQNDYRQSSSIRWFTRESFIYSILSKACRMRDIGILIQMGFFIQDIHREIQRLHSKVNKQNRLTVYRGQGITQEDFHKIVDNVNGFLSFNNFLVTTTDKDLSLTYARSARDNHELTGVLFQLKIDSSKALFTPLDKISYYSETEKEILFSIENIFRIQSVHQIGNDLWQVQLRLTNNENEEIMHVKELIEKEIEGGTAAERLGSLMNKLQMPSESKPTPADMETEKPVEENVETAKEVMETEQSPTIDDVGGELPENALQITSDL